MKELQELTDQEVLSLKDKYEEYRKERVRLVKILNYARDQYYKHYNKVKWNKWNTEIVKPEFKNNHFEDSQLDELYHQVLDAQEHYQKYRESEPLFNSEKFEERLYYLLRGEK